MCDLDTVYKLFSIIQQGQLSRPFIRNASRKPRSVAVKVTVVCLGQDALTELMSFQAFFNVESPFFVRPVAISRELVGRSC